MQRPLYIWLATGTGLLILLALVAGGAFRPDAEQRMPLLAMLLMAEFGGIVTAAAAFFGLRQWVRKKAGIGLLLSGIASLVLAGGLLFTGVVIWQGFIVNG